jgi:hypothetical protein
MEFRKPVIQHVVNKSAEHSETNLTRIMDIIKFPPELDLPQRGLRRVPEHKAIVIKKVTPAPQQPFTSIISKTNLQGLYIAQT